MSRRARTAALAAIALLGWPAAAPASHVRARMLDTAVACTGFRHTPNARTFGYVEYAVPVPDVAHGARAVGTLRVAGSSVTREEIVGGDHVVHVRHTIPASYTYSYELRVRGRMVAQGTIRVTSGAGQRCREADVARAVERDRRAFQQRIAASTGEGGGEPAPPTQGRTRVAGAGVLSRSHERWGFDVHERVRQLEARAADRTSDGGPRWPLLTGLVAGALAAAAMYAMLARRARRGKGDE